MHITRRELLVGMGAAALGISSTTCNPFNRPGVCSPDLTQSLQKFDLDKLMQGESVLLTPLNTGRALLSQHIRTVTFSKNGLWIGYGNQMPDTVGFLHLDGQPGIEICGPVGEKGQIKGRVNAIAEHPELGVVVATDRFEPTNRFGVYIFDRGRKRWIQHLPENKLNGDQSYGIYLDISAVLVATWEGVRRWDGKRWSYEDYLMPEGKRLPVHAIIKPGSAYWVGLLHDGVYRVNPGNPTENFLYTEESTSQLASNEIRDIQVSPDRKIWVLGDPGIAQYNPRTNQWEKVTIPGLDTEQLQFMQIKFSPEGEAFIAGKAGILYRDSSGNWHSLFDRPALGLDIGKIGKEPYVAGATEEGLFLARIPR